MSKNCNLFLKLPVSLAATMMLMMAFLTTAPVLSAQTTSAPTHVTRSRSHADLIDVNTATAEQLQSVPGITELYARRILAGRPYTTKRHLLTRGILPRIVYDQVKTSLVAHRKKK